MISGVLRNDIRSSQSETNCQRKLKTLESPRKEVEIEIKLVQICVFEIKGIGFSITKY
jgi:hypothetical protein